MADIDLVIPMVFPQDAEWQREYERCHGNADAAKRHVRFRSWGTEELLVQCVMKWMPWVRYIHILLASESQEQEWMKRVKREKGKVKNSLPQPEVRIVYHREFMPEKVLPCFNVNTIEMHLHRIPGLSEHFIYSNDDFFPLSPLEPSDFFRPATTGTEGTEKTEDTEEIVNCKLSNCKLLWPCQHHNEKPYPVNPNVFQRFVMNGLNMVAADFGKQFGNTWLRGGHSMQPMLRSTVEKVCALHADRIGKSFTLGRTDRNFNQYIFPFYQHLSGEYVDYAPRRQYVGPGTPTGEIARIIRDTEAGIVCLNDNEKIVDWERRAEIVRREISEKLKGYGL